MNAAAPNTARGQATITLAGKQYPIKFNINVLRDWTKLTGRVASDFGLAIVQDHVKAFSGIIVCAVRRFVSTHAEFMQDQAVDLLEEMSQPEADAIAVAIAEATTKPNPLLIALSREMEKATQLHAVESSDTSSDTQKQLNSQRAEDYRNAATE